MDEYRSCRLCPNDCRVDRGNAEGICRQYDTVKIAWAGLHRGEEPPVSGEKGSGMIFFTGCPLHCQYCQNRQISGSDGENYGVEVTEEELAMIMLSLEHIGAHSLNLVTGTHFIPSIISALDIARADGFALPVVWNSSGYESIHGLELIDPYIDLYLLDCKTLSRKTAKNFCRTSCYADAIIPVMDWIKKHHPCTDIGNLKGTLLRHLVFPGELESTYEFLRVFAADYKDSFFLSLMTQFVPPLGDIDFPHLSEDEYDSLVYLMEDLGIDNGFMQDQSDDDILWIPDFRKDIPFPQPFADPDPVFLSIKHRS